MISSSFARYAVGGSNITHFAPISTACSVHLRDSAAPYAATPGTILNPAGAASNAVFNTLVLSSGVNTWYSPSDPFGIAP